MLLTDKKAKILDMAQWEGRQQSRCCSRGVQATILEVSEERDEALRQLEDALAGSARAEQQASERETLRKEAESLRADLLRVEAERGDAEASREAALEELRQQVQAAEEAAAEAQSAFQVGFLWCAAASVRRWRATL